MFRRLAYITGQAMVLLAPATAFAADESSGDKIGFPQFNPSSYASQVFWLVISFCLLYYLMSRIALPRVAEVLDLRHKQREEHLTRAEDLRQETDKVKETYENTLAKAQEDAQRRLAQAETEISEMLAKENSAFTENARKRIAAAEQAIAEARQSALGSLPDIAAEIASEMAEKVADLQVNKAETKKVVETVMSRKEG